MNTTIYPLGMKFKSAKAPEIKCCSECGECFDPKKVDGEVCPVCMSHKIYQPE